MVIGGERMGQREQLLCERDMLRAEVGGLKLGISVLNDALNEKLSLLVDIGIALDTLDGETGATIAVEVAEVPHG
jgi:hypothetical protein